MTEPWTRPYFDSFYLRRWELGSPGEEELAHVDFLVSQLSAKPGDSLLDVGCGQGRYSLGFAMRRLRVTGIDASAPLLREARQLAGQVGAPVDWVLGDMRALPLARSHSFAILFDAFGFFDRSEENEAVMHELSRVTLSGGRVVLAMVNGPRVLSMFEGRERQQRGGRVITIDRQLDTTRRILKELVTIEEQGVTETAERQQSATSGRVVHPSRQIGGGGMASSMGGMLCEIRPVGRDSMDAVLGVYRACEDFLALGPQPKADVAMVLRDVDESQRHGGLFCGIYDATGRMIGVADFTPSGFDGQSQVAFISLVMVVPSLRGQGIGTEVVGLIEREVRRDPLVTVIRSAVQVNNPDAQRFWLRHGYQIVGGPEAQPDGTTILGLRKAFSHAV